MRKNKNKSFYHYEVCEFDENNQPLKKYFLTSKDVCEYYGVSYKLIQSFINNENYISKKLKNVKIFKCYKPVYDNKIIEYDNTYT